MRRPTLPHIGERFGKLVVIRKSEVKRLGRDAWVCLCDCSKQTIVAQKALRNTNSCGCSKARWKYVGDEASFQDFFRNYKNNAKTRNILFDLSLQDFKSLTSQSCFYCGVASSLKWIRSSGVFKPEPYIANGVDRVDSKQGYIINNCVPCCSSCNWMKNDFSQQEFIDKVFRISSYLRG